MEDHPIYPEMTGFPAPTERHCCGIVECHGTIWGQPSLHAEIDKTNLQ
jgi:hypothetical protein